MGKEKLRIAAYPRKTTSTILGQTGTADQTAVAVKMKKVTPRQVAADVKPPKESTTVECRTYRNCFKFCIKWELSSKHLIKLLSRMVRQGCNWQH